MTFELGYPCNGQPGGSNDDYSELFRSKSMSKIPDFRQHQNCRYGHCSLASSDILSVAAKDQKIQFCKVSKEGRLEN